MGNKILHFYGKVTPERYPITVNPSIKSVVKYEDFNLEINLEVAIFTSQVNCFVKIIDDPDGVDLETIKNLIHDSVHSIVDLFGFIYGISYRVEITSYSDGEGDWRVFGINHPCLQKEFGIFDSIDPEVLKIILKSPAISSVVLHDFRMAMESPALSGLFCYRAIESIMQEVTEKIEGKDKIKWILFRDMLEITQDQIMEIKNYADDSRHGKLRSISGADREKILIGTRKIIEKYIQFLIKSQLQKSQT